MRVTKILLPTAIAFALATNAECAPVNDTPPSIIRQSVSDYAAAALGNYTGLIVDCRGLGLRATMSPVIKNINGTKIYGHKNLDYDRINREGMVASSAG